MKCWSNLAFPKRIDVVMPAEFKIVYSAVVKAKIKELHFKAIARGDVQAFPAALVAIDQDLRTRSRTFGEPLYNLHNLQIRMGARRPVVVYWGVHDEEPVVFVRDF